MGHQRLTVAAKSDFLQMRLPSRLFLLLLAICMLTVPTLCMPDHHPPTPIIGGLCKLGSPDIQIGGKQTQFFLRCEPEPESAPGEGIWAVKSKNTGTTPTKFPAAEVVKNAQQQQQQQPRKSAPKITSYTCDLVTNAYEHGFCETDENCLQPIYLDRNAFLQCDSTTRRWVKRHCQPGFNFDFERQACIAHTTVKPGHTFRQFPNSKEKKQLEEDNFFAAPLADSVPETKNRHNSAEFVGPKLPKGIVCTFAQCSADKANGDGCNVGTCNNGYCCSAAVGALPTANFPADHTKLADHPQPTTNWTSTSSTTPPPTVSAPLPMMPPSILVIALNEQQQPSGQQLPWNDDHFGGSSISLQKILATLQHQRAFPRAEPLPELCSTGFRSPIRCSASSGECPPGLACDLGPKLCCPIPLAKAQKQPKRQSTSHGNTKWPNANLEGNAQEKQNGRRRMALRRRLARKHFHSFFGCGGTSALGGCCSPCMPVNLLVSDQNPLAINPNLFTANFLTDSCPGGVPPLTSCGATGYCAPPLQCYPPGICCSAPALPPPVLAPPPPAAYACPGGLPALGQCIGGRCLSPAAVCTSPANVCCAQAVVPAAIPATVCPDGTQAAGACVNNMCGAGFTCNQGLCCTNSSQTPRCLDGSQSIGACIQGRCGYTCTTGNICCPSQLNPCPPGQVSIGLAVNGRCPSGYTNINGQCCGTQSQQSQISCPEIDSTGPCDSNQQCPEPGFACDTANNWCCPQVFENEDAIGPCIQGEGGTRLCPEGYACVGEGEGECRRLDTGTCPPDEQLGPCGPNNECPNGYECLEGFCCRIDNSTRFRRKRSPQSAFLRLVRGTRK